MLYRNCIYLSFVYWNLFCPASACHAQPPLLYFCVITNMKTSNYISIWYIIIVPTGSKPRFNKHVEQFDKLPLGSGGKNGSNSKPEHSKPVGSNDRIAFIAYESLRMGSAPRGCESHWVGHECHGHTSIKENWCSIKIPFFVYRNRVQCLAKSPCALVLKDCFPNPNAKPNPTKLS